MPRKRIFLKPEKSPDYLRLFLLLHSRLMKKYYLTVLCVISYFHFFGQTTQNLVNNNPTWEIDYVRSTHDQVVPNQDTLVIVVNNFLTHITSKSIINKTIKFPFEEFYVDWSTVNPNYTKVAHISDENVLSTDNSDFLNKYTYEFTGESKKIMGYTCHKAVTIVNSNTIELWYTKEVPFKGSPVEMGQELGLVLEYIRNGNSKITAVSLHESNQTISLPLSDKTDALSYQDALWKSRFIQIPIFEQEQINFTEMPLQDSIFRFAHGTVIVKKVNIPKLKKGTQGFVQLIQKSKGDAYDRTGSVFLMIPNKINSFFDGMKKGMDFLEAYENGNGKQYRGMVRSENFEPSVELMRFFTPFGVNHFNDRVSLKGKTWQDSAFFRQDISELVEYVSDKEVYIGVYIGNYDNGGHEVSLELTFHPGWDSGQVNKQVLPLFNTTNVMEMGGQEYPTMFDKHKGLKVNFSLDQDSQNVKLRYITTGHGGWAGGDEFVPKANSIYLNGKLVHSFIPWRVDCGSYRLYNPVSGNFQNGLSSSDLSRSNWCPASVTSPEYIDLGNLKAGTYTMEIDIPQGEPEGSSFSYWNVSGLLIY